MNALCVACGFQMCNVLLTPLLLPIQPYQKLKKCQQKEFAVRVLSTCFSCLVVPLALCCLASASPSCIYCRETALFALGYFMWDLFLCCRYYDEYGTQFLFHACFCTATYYIVAVEEQMVLFGVSALLYETSTVLLNFRWLLLQLGVEHNNALWQWTNKCFAVVFLLVRLGFGSVLTYKTVHYCWVSTQESIGIRLFSVLNILMSFVLNVFWGTAIVGNIIKHYQS